MLKIEEYPVMRRTDRDLEIPNILYFLKQKKDTFESVLDVGCHYTAGYYANEIRLYAKQYHGLDPIFDEEVHKIVDKYIQEDFLLAKIEKYDFVLCCSTIEHIGMYPLIYSNRPQARDLFFTKLLETTKKYLWISFPVGKAYEISKEMSIIPPDQCEKWIDQVKDYKTEIGFFHSEGPQAGYPWKKATKEQCYAQQYIDSVGNQSICIMEVEK